MINYAGIALFLFGNKLDGNEVISSNGMREEFEIAKQNELFLLPIGATGYMSKELWLELNTQIQDDHNISNKMKELYLKLGDLEFDSECLIDSIIEILDLNEKNQ
ncbi:hypothetical protein NB620_15065, partial [Vibrio alginolyticus]|nr:hypothetical protein [Vibrio alginolyticus]